MRLSPSTKVTAAGAGGTVSTLVLWIFTLLGVDVPPEVAAAIASIISFAAGWLVTEKTDNR